MARRRRFGAVPALVGAGPQVTMARATTISWRVRVFVGAPLGAPCSWHASLRWLGGHQNLLAVRALSPSPHTVDGAASVKSSQVVPVLSNWVATLCAVTLTAAIPILSSCRSVSDRKTGLAGCCRSPPLERVVSLSLSFSASLAAFALRWSSIA